MSRSSGVLLPMTALPGAYGCGTMGEEARISLDWMAELGFSAWQVLPLHTPYLCNSPYSADSAFAGYAALIDAADLVKRGLLSAEDARKREIPEGSYSVDYEQVNRKSEEMLRAAFAYSGEATRTQWEAFAHAQAHWLPDYALFRALAAQYGSFRWDLWPCDIRNREEAAMQQAQKAHRQEMEYIFFVQWIWDLQWQEIRKYAQSVGVEIIGDMPMFIALESADAWAHSELFAIRDAKPYKVAGAPPDAFAMDGQLWGNPQYNWVQLKEENYEWFLKRLERAFTLYDRLRLDHFRGFSAYWEIPADAKTAKEGKWVKGPGMDLFRKVKERFPEAKIIAEDLGQLDADVHALRDKTGFPGMRVLQFGFAAGAEEHLPHNIPVHCVAYSGTHDNNTTLGYLYEASQAERDKFIRYSGLQEDWGGGGRYAPGVRAMLRLLWSCPAELVVTTFQDLFGWGADTRMNIPGIPDGQWEVRLTWEALRGMDKGFILDLQRDFERMKS